MGMVLLFGQPVNRAVYEVIPEEFEASLEVFSRIMARYMVPREEIESYTEKIRAAGYRWLQTPDLQKRPFVGLDRPLRRS
jgi:CPA2 family monovalent cation:H+ antiporter-2